MVWAKPSIGLGRWVRSRHEILLIATRGNPPCPAMGTQWESVIPAERGAHSEKPEFAYRLIEAYFPTVPKIELNARIRRPGWDPWGLEAPAAPMADERSRDSASSVWRGERIVENLEASDARKRR